MAKNPVYGFEKPYLCEIEKEFIKYADKVYYDDFDNLIIEKNPNTNEENIETVLFAVGISDNAFLVNEIKENGKAGISPLIDRKSVV